MTDRNGPVGPQWLRLAVGLLGLVLIPLAVNTASAQIPAGFQKSYGWLAWPAMFMLAMLYARLDRRPNGPAKPGPVVPQRSQNAQVFQWVDFPQRQPIRTLVAALVAAAAAPLLLFMVDVFGIFVPVAAYAYAFYAVVAAVLAVVERTQPQRWPPGVIGGGLLGLLLAFTRSLHDGPHVVGTVGAAEISIAYALTVYFCTRLRFDQLAPRMIAPTVAAVIGVLGSILIFRYWQKLGDDLLLELSTDFGLALVIAAAVSIGAELAREDAEAAEAFPRR